MKTDAYEPVNYAWPAELPPITRPEAQQAARKLAAHFGRGRHSARAIVPGGEIRKCWMALTPPFGSLNRGWRRLVHDVSHDVFRQTHLNTRRHGGGHARLEAEMIAYVLAQEWLTGRLKSKPRATVTLATKRAQRLQHAEVMLTTWQHRLKVAQGRVKKWGQRARDARRLAG